MLMPDSKCNKHNADQTYLRNLLTNSSAGTQVSAPYNNTPNTTDL